MKKVMKRMKLLSGFLNGQQLKDLAWQVFHYQYFDGIVIQAPPSSIPFFGMALTLMLKNFRRPVVLFPREEQVEEAEQWASLGKNGIFALGEDGLNLACRTTYTSEGRLYGPRYPQVGQVRGEERQILEELLPPEEADPFLMCDALQEQVIVFYPGDSLGERRELLEASGVLIALEGQEDLAWLFDTQLAQLTKLHRRGIPVVVTGLPERFDEPGLRRQLLLSGVISGGDMTREAALVKLMWTLARTGSIDGVRLYFGLSFGGEVTQGEQ